MKKFIPDIIAESIYDINYDILYEAGIRLLVFDIDGTILKTHDFDVSERLVELFATLNRKGFTVTLLTKTENKRLIPVLEKTKIKSGFLSKRSHKKSFDEVVEHHPFPKREIAMIGNDLYVDIYGANSFGITSIFVGSLDLKISENKVNIFILRKIKSLFTEKSK